MKIIKIAALLLPLWCLVINPATRPGRNITLVPEQGEGASQVKHGKKQTVKPPIAPQPATNVFEQLIDAINAGDLSKVQKAIKDGADVNARSAEGLAPLHYAALNCDKDIAEVLLKEQKIDVNIRSEKKDNYQRTPLHYAAVASACLDFGKLLIEHGANINLKEIGNARPETPIELAKTFKNDALAKAWADAYQEILNKPLLAAVKSGDLAKVKQAIRAGADINAKSSEGLAPLHYAIINCNKDVVQELLNAKGKDGNKIINIDVKSDKAGDDERTPLHYAASSQCKDAQEIGIMLINEGADLYKDEFALLGSVTAYNAFERAKKVHGDAFAKAWKAAYDEIHPTKEMLNNRLIEGTINGNITEVRQSIKDGADVNALDAKGFAPLHYAVIYCHKEIVEQLLNAKDKNGKPLVNVNAQSDKPGDFKNTPLHYALLVMDKCSDTKGIGLMLIQAGADVNQKTVGMPGGDLSPLDIADKIDSRNPNKAKYEEIAAAWRAAAEAKKVRRAGGILPYSIDPQTGEVKLLLSYGCTVYYRDDKDACRGTKAYIPMPWALSKKYCQDKWTDFGGAIEDKDLNNYSEDEAIKVGAARETHEETIGFFTGAYAQDASKDDETKKGVAFWKNKLDDKNKVVNAVKSQTGKTIYTYWFAKIDYPKEGESAQTAELLRRYNALSRTSVANMELPCNDGKGYLLSSPNSFIEKKRYRWVSAQAILDAIKDLKEDVTATANIVVKDPEDPSKNLELYYRFVNSLIAGRDVLQKIVNESPKIVQPAPAPKPTPVQPTQEQLLTDEVIDAIKGNDINAFESLIRKQGFNVNARDTKGYAPLHYAAKNAGVGDYVAELAKMKGVDANIQTEAPNEYKRTPLHYAAINGSRDAGINLIKAGADLDKKEEGHTTPGTLWGEWDVNKTPREIVNEKYPTGIAKDWQAVEDALKTASKIPTPKSKEEQAFEKAATLPSGFEMQNEETNEVDQKALDAFEKEAAKITDEQGTPVIINKLVKIIKDYKNEKKGIYRKTIKQMIQRYEEIYNKYKDGYNAYKNQVARRIALANYPQHANLTNLLKK